MEMEQNRIIFGTYHVFGHKRREQFSGDKRNFRPSSRSVYGFRNRHHVLCYSGIIKNNKTSPQTIYISIFQTVITYRMKPMYDEHPEYGIGMKTIVYRTILTIICVTLCIIVSIFFQLANSQFKGTLN